jgi:hypothetical protein
MNATTHLRPHAIRLGAAVGWLLAAAIAAAQPQITRQPQSQTNAVGTTATFTVEATGTLPLAYQWQKYLTDWSDLADRTDAGLVLTNVQTSDAADYRVTVTNIEGAVTSAAAHLYVIVPPAITVQPTNFASVSLGASVGNRVVASGTAPLAYQWRLYGAPVPGQTKSSISLSNVQVAVAGDYTAVVTNLGGSVTSRVVTLTVDATFTKITTGPGEPKSAEDYCCSLTWWDYDNDGFLDLFIANGFIAGQVRNRLYHNNQDGTFTRITNVISTTLGTHIAGAVADYDNDGDEDLFVPSWSGAQEFYRNDGAGSFTRLTKQQVGPALGDMDVTMEAAWADFDRDGFIDLFRANGYPSPANDCLYRNNGDGTFTKMTTNEVGQLVNDKAATEECAWGDYDNDGWPDLWVLNTGGNNLLYRNDGGFFRKVTDPNNSVVQQSGSLGAGVWGDYDNDGFLDLFVTGVLGPHTLHRNLGGVTFTNVTASAGIPSTHRGEDASWADYDNDGFLDLYITADPPYPNLLLHNNGDGTFTSVDVGSPIHDNTAYSRWGIGWADYDNDGFLDLAVACLDGPNDLFYHNNGNSNHWLRVKLTGTASNRSAIGAKVRLQATIRGREIRQMREITGNTGWSGGTPGLLAHFGLGDATNVGLVRIEWPSGLVQELHDVAANQSLKITEHQEGVTNAPRLTASRSASGSVQLTLTGQANLLYVFEASTNLGRWTKIAVRTNLTGSVDFTDSMATNYPQRFYRAVAP